MRMRCLGRWRLEEEGCVVVGRPKVGCVLRDWEGWRWRVEVVMSSYRTPSDEQTNMVHWAPTFLRCAWIIVRGSPDGFHVGS